MTTKHFFLFMLACFLFSCSSRKAMYYKYIGKAYVSIVEEDYKKSVKSFKKARKKINYFGANDHYNAFQAALKVNDLNFAKYNALQLAERGMCYNFFLQYPQITSNPQMKEDIIQACKHEKKTNTFYADSLYRMMQEDSDIHSNPETYYLRRYTDSLNFEEFKSLVSKFGLPSEERIGIQCTASLKGFNAPVYHILIKHFAMSNFNGVNDLIKTMLDSMIIDPTMFVGFNALLPKDKIAMGGELLFINGEYYVEKTNSGTTKEINRNRKKYGLWSIEEQILIIRKKAAGGELRDFRISTGSSTFDVLPEHIEKIFMKIGENVIDTKKLF